MNTPDTFTQLISRWGFYLRLRRSFGLLLPGLLFGLSAAIGFLVSVLGRALIEAGQFGWLMFTISLACMLSFALVGFFRPLDAFTAARFFDHHFSLYDRLATAVELAAQSANSKDSDNVFISLQQADALQAAAGVRIGTSFFIQITRWQSLLAAALIVASLGLAVVSRPLFVQAQQREAIRQAIQQQIDLLRTEQEKINQNQALTPEKRLELSQKLENAIAALQKAQTLEQAVAALQQAQADLNANNSAQIQSEANDLQQAGQQLVNQAENSSSPLNSIGQSLASGDPARASEKLQQLDLSSFTPSQIQQLADQLDQLAETLKSSNPALADQLQKAASALRKGDLASARQALQQASDMMNASAERISQASAAAQASAQVSQANQHLLQAGQNAQAAGQGAANSSSAGSGQGNQGGQSQGSSQGSQNGAGAGKGISNGSQGSSAEAGSNPIDQNNGAGDGGEGTYTPGNTSSHIGGTGGADVTLPPSQVNDQVTDVTGANPGKNNTARIPYWSLNIDPVQTYRKYFDSGEIPLELQPVISSYFSSFSK